jgi:hypothetical protein
MATYERKMGFSDSEPITPADHEEILRFHDARGQEQSVMDYALSHSAPPHRGTRLDPPLKPINDLDWGNDADLLREIMK